jgi:hypothetical protein
MFYSKKRRTFCSSRSVLYTRYEVLSTDDSFLQKLDRGTLLLDQSNTSLGKNGIADTTGPTRNKKKSVFFKGTNLHLELL